MEGTGGDAATSHPFKCSGSTNGTDPITVVAGDVNTITATNLTPTVSASGTQYVYLNVTVSLTLTSNNYVVDLSVSAVAIATGSSLPANSTTHCYIPVATYVDGVKTVQSRTTSLMLGVRDDGSGPGTPSYLWVTA